MLPRSSLRVVEGDIWDGARGQGTPSADYSYETPGCRGEWESGYSQNPDSWVFRVNGLHLGGVTLPSGRKWPSVFYLFTRNWSLLTK